MSYDDTRKFGDIDFQGKDISLPAVKFDRLAISGRGELLLVSLFAEAQRVKAIRAILCGGAKATANAAGIKVNRPGQENYYAHTPGRLNPSVEGYQVWTHKLGFGLVHALFITRTPGFMKVVTEESLWQELKGSRFTTPILRPWMPHIESRLREKDLLEDAHVFNCNCGIMSANTKHLDEIVSEGLSRYEIRVVEHATTEH